MTDCLDDLITLLSE